MTWRRVAATALLATLAVGACGGNSDVGSSDADNRDVDDTDVDNTEVSTAATAGTRPVVGSCDALADRWVEIQQSFLDNLGDAAVADVTSKPALIDAGRRMGLLLLEQGRDIERVGCQTELAPGSPLLCAHLPELEPRGPAGSDVVDRLAANCP